VVSTRHRETKDTHTHTHTRPPHHLQDGALSNHLNVILTGGEEDVVHGADGLEEHGPMAGGVEVLGGDGGHEGLDDLQLHLWVRSLPAGCVGVGDGVDDQGDEAVMGFVAVRVRLPQVLVGGEVDGGGGGGGDAGADTLSLPRLHVGG
jgi:hypothetical protein